MGDGSKNSRNSVFYSAASQDEAAMAAMARAKAKNDARKAQQLSEGKLAKATDAVAGEKLEESGSAKGQTFVKDKNDPFATAGRNDPAPAEAARSSRTAAARRTESALERKRGGLAVGARPSAFPIRANRGLR